MLNNLINFACIVYIALKLQLLEFLVNILYLDKKTLLVNIISFMVLLTVFSIACEGLLLILVNHGKCLLGFN